MVQLIDLLRRGFMLGSALVVLAPVCAVAAFDPDAGAEKAVVSPVSALPDPRMIYRPTSTVATHAGVIMPSAPLMPAKPLYPERVATRANDTADAYPDNAEISAPISAPLTAPAATAFTPPVPLSVLLPPPPALPASLEVIPSVEAAPPVAAGLPAPSPVSVQQAAREAAVVQKQVKVSELSDETRSILGHVRGNLDKPAYQKPSTLTMSRVTPEINEKLGNKPDAYESVGISIKVRRPGLDVNNELYRAYTSLMGGDNDAAIETYKNILSTEPTNQDALFGLAATYHRLGNLDRARSFYGALLKTNPSHRDGLNNFLVLVSDESPQDALPELQRLEARNPLFSPIPAQIALVLEKLGYQEEARNKMLKAIDLAPDNLTYKYNLAIMLDRQGQKQDASALYRMLIESSQRGLKVPASVDTMQRRVNYLMAELNTKELSPQMQAVSDIN